MRFAKKWDCVVERRSWVILTYLSILPFPFTVKREIKVQKKGVMIMMVTFEVWVGAGRIVGDIAVMR